MEVEWSRTQKKSGYICIQEMNLDGPKERKPNDDIVNEIFNAYNFGFSKDILKVVSSKWAKES